MTINADIEARALRLARDRSAPIPGGALGAGAVSAPIAGGGSGRTYLRIAEGKRSLIALAEPDGGEELRRYVELAAFLGRCGIPVPEVYAADEAGEILIVEDLGDTRLEDALGGIGAEGELAFYRDAIEILLCLQTGVTEAMLEAGILADRIFALEDLLAETDYFEREFVRGLAGLEPPHGWDRERRLLAERVAAQPVVFMHRDFQSRNIMVQEGRLRIVDFQAARRGPALYDAAALLKDPYHPLSPGTRRTLLMELFYRLSERGRAIEGGFERFHEQFVLSGIQRNMQALAAFAFLGRARGKPEFLRSIGPGLGLLEEGLAESGRFPAIAALASALAGALTERT